MERIVEAGVKVIARAEVPGLTPERLQAVLLEEVEQRLGPIGDSVGWRTSDDELSAVTIKVQPHRERYGQ